MGSIKSKQVYPGEYYLTHGEPLLVINDVFNQLYTGSNRLPCQVELDQLFESNVYFEIRYAVIPTSEPIFNKVLSTYFPIKLWQYFTLTKDFEVHIEMK